MKKILALLLGLIMLTGVYALVAPNLSNPAPADKSTIPGTSTEYFGIDADKDITGEPAWVYINTSWAGWINYPLTCDGLKCNSTIDLSAYTDMTNYTHYWLVNGTYEPAFGNYNDFFIDRIPDVPTNLTVTGINNTALFIDWIDSNVDVSNWILKRNNTVGVFTELASVEENYTDGGLTTGQTYCYTVKGIDDINQNSTETGMECTLVQDFTPPVEPVIIPPSGDTNCTNTPNISIDYTAEPENVTLEILSGGSLWADMGEGKLFMWNPVFPANGTYYYVFNATDPYGNFLESNYTLTIDTTCGLGINLSIVEQNYISVNPFTVKNSARADGTDWIVVGYSMTAYWNGLNPLYVRTQMTDLTSASDTIQINEDSAAMIFCGEDYDPNTQDWSGAGDSYFVDNTYDELSNAVTCTDTNPSDIVEYDIYLKIPIPSGVDSGSYNSQVDFGLYDAAI